VRGLNLSGSGLGPVAGPSEYSISPLRSVKGGEFRDDLSDTLRGIVR
jgi:hypothetical protein